MLGFRGLGVQGFRGPEVRGSEVWGIRGSGAFRGSGLLGLNLLSPKLRAFDALHPKTPIGVGSYTPT